jgi:hypothetical protein
LHPVRPRELLARSVDRSAGKLTNKKIRARGEEEMSVKTTLTNPPTIAIQIIGGALILASIASFRSGGRLWPMIVCAAGTWLLILGWQRTKEKLAAQQGHQKE